MFQEMNQQELTDLLKDNKNNADNKNIGFESRSKYRDRLLI